MVNLQKFRTRDDKRMEIMEHVIKNSLPQFMENDDGYTSDDIISSDQMSSGYGASLSFPSPPYSPQDDESNVGTETCYDCESVTMVAARMLEPAIPRIARSSC